MVPALQKVLLLLFIVISSQLSAQQFDIQHVYVDKGKVHVNFKVSENLEHERYRIRLYSSHDNFQQPLTHVSGPIAQGEVSSTGEEMQVIWDAQRELKEFEGNVQLELRGEVSYIPVHAENQSISAKQAKSTIITWDGGNPQDQIRIDLIKFGDVVESLGQASNSGRYTWQVTKDIPKGSDYAIRLVNLNNPGEEFETKTFKVKSKVGLVVKLAPVAALLVGGGVYAVTSGLFEPDEGGEGRIKDPVGTPDE